MSENMQIFLPTNLNTTIKKQIVVISFFIILRPASPQIVLSEETIGITSDNLSNFPSFGGRMQDSQTDSVPSAGAFHFFEFIFLNFILKGCSPT